MEKGDAIKDHSFNAYLLISNTVVDTKDARNECHDLWAPRSLESSGEDNNVQSKDKTGSPEVLCDSRMAIVPACLKDKLRLLMENWTRLEMRLE